jgi:hypothetical protein
MTCHDFERRWQTWLDTRDGAPNPDRAAWADHLACCARCRATDRRYTILNKALRSRTTTLEVPPLLTERLVRVLAAESRTAPRRLRAARPAALWIAGAAAASLALVVTLRPGSRPPVQRPGEAPPAPRAAFTDWVADAADATIDLARATSTPAARLGRTLFVARREATDDAAPPARPAAPGRLIRRLGGRVQSTVRPLSDGAIRLLDDLIPAGQPRDPDGRRGA